MKALSFLPPCNHVFEKAVTTWVYCSPSHSFLLPWTYKCITEKQVLWCQAESHILNRVEKISSCLTKRDVITPSRSHHLMAHGRMYKVKVVNNTKFTLKHKHRQIPLSENMFKHFPGKPRKTSWYILLCTQDNQLLLPIRTRARKGLCWWEMEHIKAGMHSISQYL